MMMFPSKCNSVHAILWIVLLCSPQAHASSGQVYPSEYAYLDSSVIRVERPSANCGKYPPMNLVTQVFSYCDGTQKRLTDTDRGSEKYNSSDYYVWNAGTSGHQLLFIFPTRVNLTTITLHYYSDNTRGLPRLRFFAVPDNFEVWNATTASYSLVDIAAVPLGGEPAGRRSVSINFNFTTPKVLMYKSSSDFMFALGEVEFFICNVTTTNFDNTSKLAVTANAINNTSTDLIYENNTTVGTTSGQKETEELLLNDTSPNNLEEPEYSQLNIVLPVVITAVLAVTIVLVVLLALLLFMYRKRNRKLNTTVELDATYSTLDRGTKQQMQPQFLDASAGLYDRIQLSPSTGQSELISKTECPTNHNSLTTSQYHKKEEHDDTEIEMSKSEYATYAVVDKTKNKKKSRNNKSSESQNSSEKGCNAVHLVESVKVENLKHHQSERKENLEEMYAVVQKKSKKCEEQVTEETAPPVPSHTIECLYTAVQKKPK